MWLAVNGAISASSDISGHPHYARRLFVDPLYGRFGVLRPTDRLIGTISGAVDRSHAWVRHHGPCEHLANHTRGIPPRLIGSPEAVCTCREAVKQGRDSVVQIRRPR